MAGRNKKVVRYRKPFHINIGVIVFFIIFVYMVVVFINYLKQDRISMYEVAEKNISDDNTYKGIILRDETLYYTDKAGYINYYIGDGERASKKSTIYTIDETGEIYQMLSNASVENTLSKEDSEKIRNAVASFRKEYKEDNYTRVSDFKYDVENIILEQSTKSLLSDLNDLTSNKKRGSFEVVNTKKSGIVAYTMDGWENTKAGDITADTFKNMEETRVQLRTNEAVAQGSPVYKLINSENWSIIIPLSDSQYKKLKDCERVKMTIKKDNLSLIAGITTYENGGSYFGTLQMNKYMIQYINDRFLDLEIQLNSAEGLKIPVTSILEKEFLLVPNEYISVGGKTNTTGVVREKTDENGEASYEFVSVSVFKKTETESYISSDNLSDNNIIVNTETNKTYQVGKKARLEGAYNVNKGYAVFRAIEKIYENNEYVIVKKDTPYGLSVYDNIVVNAESIEESALIKN